MVIMVSTLCVRLLAALFLIFSTCSCNGQENCKSKINCGPYRAFLSVWNSTKGEKVITTKHYENGFALRNVTEHPITLQNLFRPFTQISRSVYYVTFSGRYLSVDEKGFLSVKPRSISEVARFVSYWLSNTSAHVSFMCAFVSNKTTDSKSSYLVSPFKPFLRLNDSSCESYENFSATASELESGNLVNTEHGSLKLKQEDYQFHHVHVTKPMAYQYVSKELLRLCWRAPSN